MDTPATFSMLPPECYDQVVGFLRYKDVSTLAISE
jgi:hypothetical protein